MSNRNHSYCNKGSIAEKLIKMKIGDCLFFEKKDKHVGATYINMAKFYGMKVNTITIIAIDPETKKAFHLIRVTKLTNPKKQIPIFPTDADGKKWMKKTGLMSKTYKNG